MLTNHKCFTLTNLHFFGTCSFLEVERHSRSAFKYMSKGSPSVWDLEKWKSIIEISGRKKRVLIFSKWICSFIPWNSHLILHYYPQILISLLTSIVGPLLSINKIFLFFFLFHKWQLKFAKPLQLAIKENKLYEMDY